MLAAVGVTSFYDGRPFFVPIFKEDPMNLSDSEKRILYQADGYGKSEVLSELRFGISYMPKPEQREAARSLIHKLENMPERECMELIQDIRKNYRVPGGPKTIGELLAEARQKSGAERLKGHDIMALERFDDTTRHMIIFDVLSSDASVGDKGDKMRLFLTDAGYQRFLESQEKGEVKLQNHAKVSPGGYLHYDNRDRAL